MPGVPATLVAPEVADALAAGEAVVALESTLISFGLPRPDNVRTAREVEDAVRAHGAVPATIAVVGCVVRVGLDDAALQVVAHGTDVVKAGIRDLAPVVARGGHGATTVAATAHLAARAGVRVFATGGLGGVHREARTSWDESADLVALSRTGIVVVCAGVKSILDVPATLERLESLSVGVLGYGTDTFAGFYLRDSGCPVPARVDSPEEVAAVLRAARALGTDGHGLVVANPLPEAEQLDPALHEATLRSGLDRAAAAGLRGKDRRRAPGQGRDPLPARALPPRDGRCEPRGQRAAGPAQRGPRRPHRPRLPRRAAALTGRCPGGGGGARVRDMPAYETFRAARDGLLELRGDPERAAREFRWPELPEFNWALDWFDRIAEGNDAPALWIVEEDGSEARYSFAELASRSAQLAAWLRGQDVNRGDRLLLVLPNCVELWLTLLAAMKLGAVVIPATTLLPEADLRERVERGDVRHVVATSELAGRFSRVPGSYTRIAVGEPVPGWLRFDDTYDLVTETFEPEVATRGDESLLLYFTSGTTAQPKLVEHTHLSYPVGHLSTMYWIGLRPGDVHLNVSSPGWAKHAWSNVFAPWNAGATVLVVNATRFAAGPLLDAVVRCGVTTFCAPPTVWRMLVQEDLTQWRPGLREVVGAGEPLNPEVIEQVHRAWGLVVRDGYGQTETTAQIGNPPGATVKPGSMGRPLPGYVIDLVDPVTGATGDEGEICIDLAARPLALMAGYRGGPSSTDEATRDGWYHTGDVATRDAEGYLTYVGRTDDVFKASDYRISPFELESVLLEHEAVAEAAVVPAPDPTRLAVPKAYVVLARGYEPSPETALAILRHAREHLAPYKRIRRLEFAELPKTISGKIRRVELRGREEELSGRGIETEYRDDQFPDLRGA